MSCANGWLARQSVFHVFFFISLSLSLLRMITLLQLEPWMYAYVSWLAEKCMLLYTHFFPSSWALVSSIQPTSSQHKDARQERSAINMNLLLRYRLRALSLLVNWEQVHNVGNQNRSLIPPLVCAHDPGGSVEKCWMLRGIKIDPLFCYGLCPLSFLVKWELLYNACNQNRSPIPPMVCVYNPWWSVENCLTLTVVIFSPTRRVHFFLPRIYRTALLFL